MTLFTIGHSVATLEQLVTVLLENEVDVLVDVLTAYLPKSPRRLPTIASSSGSSTKRLSGCTGSFQNTSIAAARIFFDAIA